ncbi:LacI family DNA-binding transcriptional regulator [Auraticoccus monumenti]|uniref:DNA-binding transcriptional regulator, LacI/PurR family n=1 Tax=Auraticoccus monumenti TaxID=675864 RepID=A0A1G6SC09_9ACTN|nr:substrate-binding domain-containing protein [Auraticoccus monumenti]SDD14428.1 DNA-binding transcriptional regulator, LacI/PurR family [Auraticoccus monumenti]
MIPHERHTLILRQIELHGMVITAELAVGHGVSAMTVRRDLEELERRGLLRRVHGGAVARSSSAATAWRHRRPVATIGMVVPSADYYFPGVVRGARAAAGQLGVRLVLGVSDYSTDREVEQVRRLLDNGVDGLLVTPSQSFDQDRTTYRLLAQQDVPAVVVERSLEGADPGMPIGGVRSDHAHGAELAVRHLLDRGHTRVAVAWRAGPTAGPVLAGVRRAMAALCPDGETTDVAIPADGTPATEQRARLEGVLDDLLAGGYRAVVVLPDQAAMSLVDIALARGLRVPGDLALIGYDDEFAGLAGVPLTAVAPPKFDVGHTALRTCFDRLRARAVSTTLTRVALLPTLAVRDST